MTHASAMTRVGIEIGGTFTDLVAMGPEGLTVVKVPSVPRRPDAGVFDALDAAGIAAAAIDELVHGSTVATNAVLERKGARLALIVTEGFRDLLHLQRQDRSRIFDLFYRKPEPLVLRRETLDVRERTLSDGSHAVALDAAETEARIAAFLAGRDCEAVAICLLNAFANPIHELTVRDIVRRLRPDLAVTCSYDVTREFREYERTSTTALSAYVQPVIDGYLGRIKDGLAGRGFSGDLSIMQSNGGRVPAEEMRRSAVTALLSGPAAGVTGAVHQAGLSGHRNIITLDIGGTSSDVCLVHEGRPDLTRESRVDDLPVMMPMIDINTVGAGGGSIVWLDEGGMLRVGPHSAGADPGPACYGRGGARPTLTDAHILCGRIPADATLGAIALDAEAARAAFAPLAAQLGMGVEQLAESAIRIAVANMVAAIRLVSTRRGHDPRDFALVPYGGAGPLHAVAVADALDIETVVVPPSAGVLSAYGLLVADHGFHAGHTRRTPIAAPAPDAVRETVGALVAELDARCDALGLAGARHMAAELDMRFVGQAFELSVPLPLAALPTLTCDDLLAAFEAVHQKIYHHGGGQRGKPVEIVSYRVHLRVPQAHVPALPTPPVDDAGAARPHPMFEDGGAVAGQRVTRGALSAGGGLPGPAVIEDATATIHLPRGWQTAGIVAGNLILTRSR